MVDPDRPPLLRFPPDSYFSCTDCGKCCIVPWRIKVDPSKAESIRETEIYQRLSKAGYQPLKILDDEFELARAEDGRCHFLQNELCGIHAEKGPSAKPSVCQLYPFSLVATPDGYFVSLAYTCPAVLAGCGEPIDSHETSLRTTVKEAPHFFPPGLEPGHRVTLTAQSVITWSEYLTFEQRMLDYLDEVQDSLDGVLRAASAALIWSGADFRSPCGLKDNLKEMLPLFVANCIASMEEKSRPEMRTEFAQSLLYGGEVKSHLLDAPAPPYQPGRQGCQLTRSIVKRYVKSKIWGKVLITGPTLTVRLLMLALSIEVLIYYYEARKSLEKVLHFDPILLEWAFDVVETDLLVHHELVLPLMSEWERVGLELREHF